MHGNPEKLEGADSPKPKKRKGPEGVYTTGQAAKICKISQQTIIRCFDSGLLKGFRVPGSRFRRIPRELLFNFMRESGIPTDGISTDEESSVEKNSDVTEIHVVTNPTLSKNNDANGKIAYCGSTFELGIIIRDFENITRIVIDRKLVGDITLESIAQVCAKEGHTVSVEIA